MSESSKEKIIKAATQLFAEKGFEGASIREIATQADVNVASINYHFKSKQNLIDFLVEDFIYNKFSHALQALEPPESFDELKIRMNFFIKQFLTMVRNEYDCLLMMQKNLDVLMRLSPDIFEKSFSQIHLRFLNFVQGAMDKKVLQPDLDPEIVAQIIFGCFFDLVKTNHVRECFGILFLQNDNFIESYTKAYSSIVLNRLEVNN